VTPTVRRALRVNKAGAGLKSFEERSSLRAWLHRIAVSGCLNALHDRRRPRECR
jgi:DNA-directed RNA polymerase specialized sigma24 family protein